jgi:kynurenine formamidase
MIDFNGYRYISLNRRDNASVHGHPKIQVHAYSFAGRETYHTISIPTHSMTHLDFTQSVTIEQFETFFLPKIFEKVAIVNCTDKQDILNQYLMTASEDKLFEEKGKYPFLDIVKLEKADAESKGENTLLSILRKLEINEKYLKDKFYSVDKDISEFDFIILRTDWFEFRFNPNTLSNMHFEGFHAFLLHPYLSHETIKYIFKNHENIQGFASDTSSLNNPMSYVNEANSFPVVQRAYRIAKEQGSFDSTNISDYFITGYLFSIDIEMEKDLNMRYVSENLINIFIMEGFQISEKSTITLRDWKNRIWWIKDSKKIYLVKKEGLKLNVYLDDKIRNYILNVAQLNHLQNDNEIITTGRLILIPVRPLAEPNGIVCELYFKKDDTV